MSFDEPGAPERVADTVILLVEDDPGDALLVQASLEEVGVRAENICWSRSAAEGFGMLQTAAPGCVLMDLGLPDALGLDAVRDMAVAAPHVPVIVLTGRQERDGAEALSVGAQDYLIKDAITAELLERSIRYAMERKRTQRAQQQLRDLAIGAAEQARLERGLLPTPILRSDRVTCASYYQPGRDNAVLGGDFYDIVETPDGRVRAVIGDVMGHGPDEAALGVHLRVAWRTLLLAGIPDELILPNLAKLLDAEDTEHPRYVTVCDITIEGNTMGLRVAGHPAPVIGSAGSALYPLTHVGPPLGVRIPGGSHWPVTSVDLPADARVVLYSDGLLECYQEDDPTGGSLGIDELVTAVGRFSDRDEPATDWVSELVHGAPRSSADDTAAVVLTVRSATSSGMAGVVSA